jgi:hypothetical protein
MHPDKLRRDRLKRLTDLPNIGKAGAEDLKLLGIDSPEALQGRCPYAMYEELCRRTGVRHDPCVIDVFLSIVHFMAGGEPQRWWEFTAQRKQRLAAQEHASAHVPGDGRFKR